MADIRPLSGPTAASARPLPAVRAQAIAAAQRAFFDQALNTAPAAAPVRVLAPSAASSATLVPPMTRLSFDSDAPAPDRPLRPGSLLDIKV